MTAQQIIQELQNLPFEEQQEVAAFLQGERKTTPASFRYLDREIARPIIQEMLTRHAELFQKLAQ